MCLTNSGIRYHSDNHLCNAQSCFMLTKLIESSTKTTLAANNVDKGKWGKTCWCKNFKLSLLYLPFMNYFWLHLPRVSITITSLCSCLSGHTLKHFTCLILVDLWSHCCALVPLWQYLVQIKSWFSETKIKIL